MPEPRNPELSPRYKPRTLDLRTEPKDLLMAASVMVPGEQIGSGLWDEMLQMTKETRREYGVVVSSIGSNLLTSKIFEGRGQRYNEDNGGSHPPSLTPRFFPHGIRSLDPRVKDLVLVHTHPKPIEIEHLPTTTMSGDDIFGYSTGRFNALVMIDTGGVHMLTGRNQYKTVDEKTARKIVSDAIKVAEDNENSVAEVRREIAKGLAPFGIKYYFSSDKKISEEGFVELTDCVSS